jgi:hypothetical protein
MPSPFSQQHDANNESAHETEDGATFSNTSTFVLVRQQTAASTRFHGGLYFHDLDIPAGSTIDTCVLTVQGTSTVNDDMSADIFMESGAASSNDFVTEADLVDRTRTSASVEWVATLGEDADMESPDFSTVLQEVVDNAGWASGNNVCVIIWAKTGSILSASVKVNGDDVPVTLDVSWTEGATGDASGPGRRRRRIFRMEGRHGRAHA